MRLLSSFQKLLTPPAPFWDPTHLCEEATVPYTVTELPVYRREARAAGLLFSHSISWLKMKRLRSYLLYIGAAGGKTHTHIEPDSCPVRHRACQHHKRSGRPTSVALCEHHRLPSFHPSLVCSYHKSGASPSLHFALITCFLISAGAQLWPSCRPHLSSQTVSEGCQRLFRDCKHTTLHKHARAYTQIHKCCYRHLWVM